MKHIPVLLHEVIKYLEFAPGQIVVDGTLGFGGHAKLICEQLGPTGIYIGIDEDREAIILTEKLLANSEPKVILKQGNFRDLEQILTDASVSGIDRLLLDLGLSSYQLDASGRGFTFQKDEPLIMTFNAEVDTDILTADSIINEWAEDDIANVLFGYGEEHFARKIALKIVEARKKASIKTTFELVKVIESAVPVWYRKRRIHPATKTFQALRIAVNSELEALRTVLNDGWRLLKPDGRLGVISFHSLEARTVKEFFNQKKLAGEGELITKKVIKPELAEIKGNPRSRSAQLRVIKKI